jgi:hypothetical protein
MIKDEVTQAAEALKSLLEIAFNPALDTWEKMGPGVIAAVRALNECKDIATLAPVDRTRAIIDTLLETIYISKGMVITYSDEQPT